MNSILSCEHLSKSFFEIGKTLNILNNISFEVKPEQTIAIVGASGSGKSTLLHLLGGLDLPTSGDVYWHQQAINKMNEKQKCRLRNKHLGFVYQFHHLLPEFTALENVAMPLLIREQKAHLAQKSAQELLQRIGLEDRQNHYPGELSGGERQRVAIARALITHPQCVLADEPTGNLDPSTAHQVLEMMLQLQKQIGTSFVIVTHNPELASQLQKSYQLKNGQLELL